MDVAAINLDKLSKSLPNTKNVIKLEQKLIKISWLKKVAVR